MLISLKNISGGLLVCDLKTKGKTLRLNNRQSKSIQDTEFTPHIETLLSKGLLLKEEVKTSKSTAKKTVQKKEE